MTHGPILAPVLVEPRSEQELDREVPGCPEWRVRDVVAHLAGNAVDVAAGALGAAPDDAGTRRQVEARRATPIADVLDEGDRASVTVEAMRGEFGEAGELVVADAVVLAHDLRGARRVRGAPGEGGAVRARR